MNCTGEQSPDWAALRDGALYSPGAIDYGIALPAIPRERTATFYAHHFRPWHVPPDSLAAFLAAVPGPDSTFLPRYLSDPEYYGENKRRHTDKRRRQLEANVRFEDFPARMQRAITIRHTSIRRLPLLQPGYDRYTKAGEGFPFDYFQETALWAHAPALILHATVDGAWYYVLTAYYKGWIPANDVAPADEDFIRAWERGRYCAPLSDEAVLKTEPDHFLTTAKIGMILPHLPEEDGAGYRVVYAAAADADGRATLKKCRLQVSEAAPHPLPFTVENLRPLVAALHGAPYGWGGLLENRDCSSTIKDLYTPFGIWVPRNSSDQARCGELTLELPQNPEEKTALIKERGVPFLTILYKPGHAMLYVGENDQGEPLIFHTAWGLKAYYDDPGLAATLDKYPLEGMHFNEEKGLFEGRKIIGQTAITTLTIGREEPAIRQTLLDELTLMTVLAKE